MYNKNNENIKIHMFSRNSIYPLPLDGRHFIKIKNRLERYKPKLLPDTSKVFRVKYKTFLLKRKLKVNE